MRARITASALPRAAARSSPAWFHRVTAHSRSSTGKGALNERLPTPTVAHGPENEETPMDTGILKYRYRDSNPGFRRERAAS
jgi:hypothetical protein